MKLTRRRAPSAVAGFFLALLAPGFASGQEKEKSLNVIMLEVQALQAIDQLELTPTQLEAFLELAKGAGDVTRRKRAAPKASNEYRQALLDLHAALLKGAATEELDQKAQEIAEKENPELDTEYEISPTARQKCLDVVNLLNPSQLAAHIATLEISDPVDVLVEALETGRDEKGEEWKETRNEATEEVGKLLRGVDQVKSAELAGILNKLLDGLHSQKTPEAAARARLESEVRKMEGKGGPFRVIHNCVEYSFAEMLSNPRLVPALEARRKEQP
jgi:hypothetical protein